jgi:hypothetical protein
MNAPSMPQLRARDHRAARIFVLAQGDFALRTNHSSLVQKTKLIVAVGVWASRFVRTGWIS